MSRSWRIFFARNPGFRGICQICRNYSSTITSLHTTRADTSVLTQAQTLSFHKVSHSVSRCVHTGFQNELLFHRITDETLDALSEFFDDFFDTYDFPNPDDCDVNFGDGVLTIKFGGDIGTYVINKQTPNKQIWLSSPTSGPKRYDFINNTWIYRHTNESLHSLLSKEMSIITESDINLQGLPYGKEPIE